MTACPCSAWGEEGSVCACRSNVADDVYMGLFLRRCSFPLMMSTPPPQKPSPSHTDPPSSSSVWRLFPSFQTSFRPLTYRPQRPLQATVETTTFLLSVKESSVTQESCFLASSPLMRAENPSILSGMFVLEVAPPGSKAQHQV